MNKKIQEGIEFRKQGKLSESVMVFSKLIEANEQVADYYYERGVTYFHLKDYQSALRDMNKAQELEPENPYRYSSRAFIKGASGDIEGGIKDYQKAVELDPEDAIAYNNLGLLQEQLGYHKKANVNFQKADNLEDVPPVQKKNNEQEMDQLTEQLIHQVNQETPTTQATFLDVLQEVKKVFTDSNARKEFLAFVKNGFRTK